MSKIKALVGWFLVRTLFLAYRWHPPPTLCLAWSFLGVQRKPERDRECVVSLLIRTAVLSDQGPIGKPPVVVVVVV